MQSKDYLNGALDTAVYVLRRFRIDSCKVEELLKELDGLVQELLMERADISDLLLYLAKLFIFYFLTC